MSTRAATMRVVGVQEFGGPDALRVFELPVPRPDPGEVRVRVRAATVNPTDTGFRAGKQEAHLRATCDPPYIPGMEAAGVIDAVGEEVTDLASGDRVMVVLLPHATGRGAYAEQIVSPRASVARSPAGIDDIEAATLPMNGATVLLALDALGLAPGDTLAVTGAAGAVGGYAMEVASSLGIRVVADAAPADVELVTRLGADVVVPRGPEVASAIREVVADGVDGLLDAAVMGNPVLPAVRDGGTVAVVRPFAGRPERGITVHQVLVTEHAQDVALLDRVRRLAEHGLITPRVGRTFPAERAAEAHRRFEAGGTRGRTVLVF